jgi:hypothetical protein
MVAILSALSISAAAGLRIALPLLLIGLLYSDQQLWANVPLLAKVPPPIALGVLVSWSLAELVLSKKQLGQRVLQFVHLVLSPWVGAIASIAVVRTTYPEITEQLVWIIAAVGGLLALVLQLVQAGWFFQLRGLPLWFIFVQDFLCVILVCLAFGAPKQGALIALMLIWLTIRSSTEWQRRYRGQGGDRHNPRQGKLEPD